MAYQLGIDVGGTFTDFALLDDTTGQLYFGKTPVTTGQLPDGILNGTADLLARVGITAADLTTIIHATPLVAETLLAETGAITGLITTEGFGDSMDNLPDDRYISHQPNAARPSPESLVPMHLRQGISERIDGHGHIKKPIQEADIASVAEALMEQGVDAIAVCLLHSFANQAHERAIGRFLRQHYPDLYVSLSVEVMPSVRAYERLSTTVCNAYVQPVMDWYLGQLTAELGALGFAGSLRLITADGRLTTPAQARQTPIRTVNSGPAASVMAGLFGSQLTHHTDLLTLSMGGNTTTIGQIRQDQPTVTSSTEVARLLRFEPGSGRPLRMPMLDIAEVNAGGSSLAWLDPNGLLHVGPEGVAAGPAAFEKGGTRPTLTDASVVLGYFSKETFLGEQLPSNKAAARRAIAEYLADPLGISIEEAAMGVHRVMNANLADALRASGSLTNTDGSPIALWAMGGAGAIHAVEVARLLGLNEVIVPVGAGVAGAIGLLTAPLASLQIGSFICPLWTGSPALPDWSELNLFLASLEQSGRQVLTAAGLVTETITVTRQVDLRFPGLGYTLAVIIPGGLLSEASLPDIEAAFRQVYEQRTGQQAPDEISLEAVTWRVSVSGPPHFFNPKRPRENSRYEIGGKDFSALKGYRTIYFTDDPTPCACPVFDRSQIRPSDTLSGPVVIEAGDATVVVGPRAYIRMDEHRNLLISLR